AEAHLIETTYVDDFPRASRDEIEWWKLAALSKKLRKRMIGASDGFDLSSPNWEAMVGLYSLLSRLFVKSLREKVGRGMRGAAPDLPRKAVTRLHPPRLSGRRWQRRPGVGRPAHLPALHRPGNGAGEATDVRALRSGQMDALPDHSTLQRS